MARMTDDAPLTDEELAEMIINCCLWDSPAVSRLIADLRATREKVKELEAELEGKMTSEEWYRDYARW